MSTERLTLTEDYHHAEGRHYRAGEHVLPADVAAAARRAGKVADDVPAKAAHASRPAAKKPAAKKPAAKAKRKPAGK